MFPVKAATPTPHFHNERCKNYKKLLFVCSVVLTRHVMLITDTYFVFDSCFLFWVSLRKAWSPSKAHWPLSISSCQFRSPPLYAQASKCVRQRDEKRMWLLKGEWDLKLCVWSFEFRRTMGRGWESWQGERKGQTCSGCKHCLRVWGEAALPQCHSRTIWQQRGRRWEGQRAEMRGNADVIQAESENPRN